MNYEKWFDNMIDKLESEYSEYLKEVDVSIQRLISFDDFAYSKFESMQDNKEDEAYEQYKERNI